MKICWLIPQNSDNPLEMIFARKGLCELQRQGFEIFIFPFIKRHYPWDVFLELIRLRKFIKTHQVELVHAHFGSTTGLIASFSGKKYVVTFRGSDINGDIASAPIFNRIRLFVGRIVSMRASSVICVSKEIADKVFCPQKTTLLPSPTDLSLFKVFPRPEAKKILKLQLEKKYFGFSSSLGRKLKRLDLAEAAIRILQDTHPEAELLKFEKVPQEDLPLYLNACEGLLLTSELEGSPNIVREALACGVPVVSFDVGDVAQWLVEDSYSTLVKQGDVSALASGLRRILLEDVPHSRRVNLESVSEESYVRRLSNIYINLKS